MRPRARRRTFDRCEDCPFAEAIEIEPRPRMVRRIGHVEREGWEVTIPLRRLGAPRLERWCVHEDAFPDDPRPIIRHAGFEDEPPPEWCPMAGVVELLSGPTKP